MYQVVSGGIMALCWILSFFFVRFWKRTGDRLFGIFSLAFLLLGMERLVLGWLNTPDEAQPRVYLVRLIAFLLILVAIIDKNRPRKARVTHQP